LKFFEILSSKHIGVTTLTFRGSCDIVGQIRICYRQTTDRRTNGHNAVAYARPLGPCQTRNKVEQFCRAI